MRTALLLLLVTSAFAQQPNAPTASLVVNGQQGPVWPVTGVSVSVGVPINLAFGGPPSAPIYAVVAPRILPAGVVTPFGLLDVPLDQAVVLADGLVDPTFRIGPTGTLPMQVGIPETTPLGLTVAVQAVVVDPTTPVSARLTAASEGTTQPGVMTQVLTAFPVYIDFAAFNVTFSFYGIPWSGVWINKNGSLTFGASSPLQTPTVPGMLGGPPRIASYWVFLPGAAGTITVQGGPSLPGTAFGGLRVTWADVLPATAAYTGPCSVPLCANPTTFDITLHDVVHDIVITHASANIQSLATMMTGIAPGNGTGAPPPTTDLSMLAGNPVVGTPGMPFYEILEVPGVFGHTGLTNPYDLGGVTLTFLNMGGSYLGT